MTNHADSASKPFSEVAQSLFTPVPAAADVQASTKIVLSFGGLGGGAQNSGPPDDDDSGDDLEEEAEEEQSDDQVEEDFDAVEGLD